MKNKALYGLMSALFISGGLYAQTLKEIPLKKPDIHSGKPLMTALMERSSHREFDSRQLSEEHLSGLLWAACGINRQESGKRTAPSSMNFQDVQLYVLMQSGIYLYNEANHKLSLVKEGDYRAMAGKQDFVATAPVNLVLVSDYSRMEKAEEKEKEFYSAIDAGFISQNIYLYCASANLNTAIIGLVNREKLQEIMNLPKHEKVVYTQAVGKSLEK